MVRGYSENPFVNVSNFTLPAHFLPFYIYYILIILLITNEIEVFNFIFKRVELIKGTAHTHLFDFVLSQNDFRF